MQRRGWLGLALIGLPLSALIAQEKVVPPPFDTKPPSTKSAEQATKPAEPATRTAEPATKPLITQERIAPPATATGSPVEGGVVVEEGFEYVPSFGDRMAGLGQVLARPFSLSWWDDSRPVSNNLMTSDIEDPYWFKADMLFSRFKEANTPPLITTSLPQASRGIIGNEGTRILYGGNIDLETHLGPRMTAGFWLEPSQAWGLEGTYFFLANRSTGVRLDSQGDPLLAAPFVDVLNGVNSAFPIANEAQNGLVQISGVVNAGAHSRIQGFEFNNIHNITRQPNRRLDWTWGYRYLGLDEAIFFNLEQGEAAPQGQQFGTQRRIIDDFGTANHFHGFNLGLRSQWYLGNWTFDLNGKLGFGANRNTVEISGLTQTATPPQFQLVNTRGGLYALNSNIGNVTEVNFSFVPEIEVGVGYYFAEHWRITCAYNFLAITSVVRPGDQIDPRINTNILDGNSGNPAVPERFHKHSTFWMSSFMVGLEYRW